MIRGKVREIFINESLRPLLKKLGRLLIVVGILWVLSFPYIARKVFTSENALRDNLKSNFKQDGSLYAKYRSHQERLLSLPEAKSYNSYILEELAGSVEVHAQGAPYGLSDNIYAYLRSADGYGNECNIVSFPSNLKASVAFGLAFIHAFVKQTPTWQAKDIIVLFYEEGDYAFAVRHFLDSYNFQLQEGVPSDTYFSSPIQGRCGYLRQGFPVVVEDFDFQKLSLQLDGVNSQMSDIDFYSILKDVVNDHTSLKYDFSLPKYFRLNPFLNDYLSWLIPESSLEWYLDLLSEGMKLLNMDVNKKGKVMPMLENIKNAFIGKLHSPHTYFIQQGVHAITFRLYNEKASKKDSKSEKNNFENFLTLLEIFIRTNDQTDEQLHAGFYFFILTSKAHFVSNSVFVYPIVLVLVGYFLPATYDLIDFNNERKKEGARLRAMLGLTAMFLAITYLLGIFYFLLPELIFKAVIHSDTGSGLCHADHSTKKFVTFATLLCIFFSALLFRLAFDPLQRLKFSDKDQGRELWFYIKSYNWYINFILAGAMVVYEFPAATITAIFIYPYLHNAVYIGSGFSQVALSLFCTVLFGAAGFVFLFGTLMVESSPLDSAFNLVQTAITDYHCAGSNVWMFMCLLVLTNGIVVSKIWTN